MVLPHIIPGAPARDVIEDYPQSGRELQVVCGRKSELGRRGPGRSMPYTGSSRTTVISRPKSSPHGPHEQNLLLEYYGFSSTVISGPKNSPHGPREQPILELLRIPLFRRLKTCLKVPVRPGVDRRERTEQRRHRSRLRGPRHEAH